MLLIDLFKTLDSNVKVYLSDADRPDYLIASGTFEEMRVDYLMMWVSRIEVKDKNKLYIYLL